MLPPIVARHWKYLDEWDGAIFVAGLGVGITVAIVIGASSYAVWGGFVLGLGALSLRRRLDRRLLEKEALPPPPPLSLGGLLLVAFGLFTMLVALVGWVLVISMATEGTAPPLSDAGMIVCFPVVCSLAALAMLRVGRRLR